MWNVAVRCADYGCWKNRSESYGINMIDLRKSAELNGMEPMELYVWLKRYPGSGRRVICYCEGCGKEREIRYDAYHDLCIKCANADPIKCEKASRKTKEQFSTQEARDVNGEKISQYHIDHPETRIEMSRIKTEYYSHQENRNAQTERTNQYVKDHPEAREEARRKSIEYYI